MFPGCRQPWAFALLALALSLCSWCVAAEGSAQAGPAGAPAILITAGDPSSGLPHWDPVLQELRDRIFLSPGGPCDGLPARLTGEVLSSDSPVEAAIQPVRAGEDLRRHAGLPRALPVPLVPRGGEPRAFDLVLRGEEAPVATLLLGLGESCGLGAARRAGEASYALDLRGEARPMALGALPEGFAVYTHDDGVPEVFVGSITGWLTVGNRFPVSHWMELMEVRFLVSAGGSGAGYTLVVWYSPVPRQGPPDPADEIVYMEQGIIPSFGESSAGEVRIPLVEKGLHFAPGGTLWIGLTNHVGHSYALGVDVSPNPLGWGFLKTAETEFSGFFVGVPGVGRPMIRIVTDAPPGCDPWLPALNRNEVSDR